jgi:aldehyde:ferredoxin oxidoreductase
VRDWLNSLVHRHSACFNTPFATNTYVYLDEDPKRLTEPETDDPGFKITELFGLLGLKKIGLSAEAACRLLKACARYGIDGAAVAELSEKADLKESGEIERSFASLTGSVTLPGKGIFSPWCPVGPIFSDFGLSRDASETEAWWERRQAVAYIFGIHPLFAVMSPELTEESMLEAVRLGTEMEIGRETLDGVIADLAG